VLNPLTYTGPSRWWGRSGFKSARWRGTADVQRVRSPFYFATHPNKNLTHRELLQAVWGPDYGKNKNTCACSSIGYEKRLNARRRIPSFCLQNRGLDTACACQS